MDTVLVIVTLISLGLAAAMGALVLKLLHDERRRSDARVEALIEAASTASAHTPGPSIVMPRPVARASSSRPAPAAAARPHTPLGGERALEDLEIRPAAASVGEIFAEPVRSSPWGRRLAVIGSLAAIALAGFAVLALDRSGGPAAVDATERAVAAPAPLELI
jgi:hypothetical protein